MNGDTSQESMPAQTSGQHALALGYAKALLAVTEKEGSTLAVMDELDSLVKDVLDKQPTFAAVLATPRISAEEKVALVQRVFGNRVSSTLLKFLTVTARHGQLGVLRGVSQLIRQLYDDSLGRVRAVVTTATPLDGAMRSEVQTAIQARLGKDVSLVTKVDPNVLGGIVVRVGDTVYDASVANRLDRLRQHAIRSAANKLNSLSAAES